MSKYFVTYLSTVFLLLLIMSGCGTLKHLPEGERLYKRAKIVIKGKVANKEEVVSELEDVAVPEPNKKILGMRIGLWAHQKVRRDEAGFFAKWVNKKIGEEPVLMRDLNTARVERLMNNRLENLGYFHNTITSDTSIKEKSGKATYQVFPGTRLMINDYKYEEFGNAVLDSIINKHLKEQDIIKKDAAYKLKKLKEERLKIAEDLKEAGFYYFVDDYLLFMADTIATEEDNSVNLTLSIKETAPSDALLRYKIGDITVYPKYSLNLDSAVSGFDTAVFKDIEFIQKEIFFRPDRLYDYVLLKEGDYFDEEDESYTSRRLNSLRTYRFVNIRYEEDSVQKEGVGYLNTSIFLSPMNKRAFIAELQAVSKSNNFAGPTLNLEYINRNIFHGGETFTVKTKLGYEAQLGGSGERSGQSSIETGIQGELLVPRMISPFNFKKRFRYSVPKTRFRLSYDYLRRVQLFTLNSFTALYGYEWNVNAFVNHQLNPISINLINLSNTSPNFQEILNDNPFLRRSFEQQFIVGLTYTFQYNKLIRPEQKSRFFVLSSADFAGNGLGLAHNLAGTDGEQKEIFGQPYAQYAKVDVDVRHYYNTSRESRLVARVFAGAGLPYGNSVSLPYSKQYFTGGPNSVRAFQIRSLGPGSYVPEDEGSTGSFFDQAGDIKVEANLEYRFPIYSIFKGAVFTDAGNVWLMNENEELEGGKFTSDWYRQLAVGAGIGLRLDINFFVIRLDVATPLRKPTEGGEFIWQNNFNIGSKSWRQQNIVWNFGIGYPF